MVLLTQPLQYGIRRHRVCFGGVEGFQLLRKRNVTFHEKMWRQQELEHLKHHNTFEEDSVQWLIVSRTNHSRINDKGLLVTGKIQWTI